MPDPPPPLLRGAPTTPHPPRASQFSPRLGHSTPGTPHHTTAGGAVPMAMAMAGVWCGVEWCGVVLWRGVVCTSVLQCNVIEQGRYGSVVYCCTRWCSIALPSICKHHIAYLRRDSVPEHNAVHCSVGSVGYCALRCGRRLSNTAHHSIAQHSIHMQQHLQAFSGSSRHVQVCTMVLQVCTRESHVHLATEFRTRAGLLQACAQVVPE